MARDKTDDAERILFTDFDGIAPAETEDVPAQSPPPPEPPEPPPQQQPEIPALASLADIASALDFDFEEDEGAAAPAAPQPAQAQAAAAAVAGARGDEPPDDELLSLPAGTPPALSPAGTPPAAAPSWAEYTRAFQTTPPAGPQTASPAPATATATVAASAADLFFRAVAVPAAPAAGAAARAPGADGMQVAFVDYRPLPGEGGFAPLAGLAAFAPDDDAEMDILSLLPPVEDGLDAADIGLGAEDDFDAGPEEEDQADSAGAAAPGRRGRRKSPPGPSGPWRGGRLGVAPAPATPYGGLQRLEEWWRPPPPGAEPDAGGRDWFAPPAGAAAPATPAAASAAGASRAVGDGGGRRASSSARAVSASAKTDVFAPVTPADDEATATFAGRAPEAAPAAARPAKPAEENEAGAAGAELDGNAGDADFDAADAADDIFSGFDLDDAWTRKAAARAAPAASDAPADPDAPAPPPAARPPTRSVDMFSGIDLEEAWREKQRRRKDTVIRQREDAYRVAVPSAADTMVIPASAFDNHDTVIMPASGFDLPDIPPAPEVAAARNTVRKKKKAAPIARDLSGDDDALGFLDDLDSFLDDDAGEEAAGEAAAAPEEPGKRARAGGLPRSLEELEIGDLISPEEEEAAAVAARTGGAVPGEDDYFPAGRMIGGDTPTGEVIAGAVPGDGGATIDDIVGQVKFGAGQAVDDSVAPPEIDDNLIDTEIPAGAMDGLEAELEAGTAAGGEGEDGEAAGGEAGGGAEEEEAVPVDPAAALAGFDDMDFSGLDDLLDDETKAMLEEDAAEDAGMAEGSAAAEGEEGSQAPAAGPGGFAGLREKALRLARRALPISWFNKVKRMIAWRENWWFYCDLFAAVVASASLAVIFSYYMWYRE